MVTANLEMPVGRWEPLARGLGTACAGFLVALPLVMLAANRSAPLMVALSAVLGLASLIASGQGGALRDDLFGAARHPAGLVALAGLGFALVSMVWSADPLASWRFFGEMFVSLAAGAVLAFVLPRVAPRSTLVWLAVSLAVAASFIVLDLTTGMSLHRVLELPGRTQAFVYNRPAIILLLLAYPALFALLIRRGLWNVAAFAFALVVAAGVLTADSGAAVLGGLVALLVFVLALLTRGAMRWLAIAGFLLVLASAPFLGGLADRVIPAKAHQALQSAHSRDRVNIWETFGSAIAFRPLTGYGFGSGAFLDRDARAKAIPPERQAMLAVGHPHNSFVQIWVEMGLAGALIAAALLVTGISALAGGAGRAAPFAFAALTAAGAIALVGHGAWQGWWIATLGATVAAFRLALRDDPSPPRS